MNFDEECKKHGGKVDKGIVGNFKVIVCMLDNSQSFDKFSKVMKGTIVKPSKPMVGKIKTKEFIWIANFGNKKRIMTIDEAEKFIKKYPGTSIYAKIKKYEL